MLTRQLRMPAYMNGHPDGMLIEAAAGQLALDDALDRVVSGEINDGKTVILLQWAQSHRLLAQR